MSRGQAWLIGILAVALLVVLPLAAGGYQWLTARFFGQVQAERTLESGPSRIVNYNRFFDLCASVQGYEDRIDAMAEELAQTDNPKREEELRTNLTGVKAQRASAVRQYNQDARKDYTQARFLDSDLPWQLDPEYEAGGRNTTCAVR